ncbi:MAG: sarcosine oxidase subunit delta [Thermodesulfobacteriota bacterium]
MFSLPCPHCGLRPVAEFKYGGPVRPEPPSGADLPAWREYLYFQDNRDGVQEEWWFHTLGCGTWIRLWRDNSSNRFRPAGEGA